MNSKKATNRWWDGNIIPTFPTSKVYWVYGLMIPIFCEYLLLMWDIFDLTAKLSGSEPPSKTTTRSILAFLTVIHYILVIFTKLESIVRNVISKEQLLIYFLKVPVHHIFKGFFLKSSLVL